MRHRVVSTRVTGTVLRSKKGHERNAGKIVVDEGSTKSQELSNSLGTSLNVVEIK